MQIGARAAHLDAAPAVAFEVDRALSGATVRAIRARVGVPAGVSADDVRAYFEANRARYDTPERYQIARILCRTRDEGGDGARRGEGRSHAQDLRRPRP